MLFNLFKNNVPNFLTRGSLTLLILLIFCISHLQLFGQSRSVERKSSKPTSTQTESTERETGGHKSSRPAPSGNESYKPDLQEGGKIKSDSPGVDSSVHLTTEETTVDTSVNTSSGITGYMFIIIPIAVIAIVVLFALRRRNKNYDSTGYVTSTKPGEKVSNSKIIVIKNVELEYLKSAIQKFCELHNQKEHSVLPRLILLPDQFVIVFPFDIRFKVFCHIINYLKYPEGYSKEYNPFIRAWCITKMGDEWMTFEILNKKVMIYNPDDDVKNDKVYLTTEDNLGFKLGFLVDSREKLQEPLFKFEPMLLNMQEYGSAQSMDFE